MIVETITENEDGSADCVVTLTNAEREHLIRFAIITMLKKVIEEGTLYTPEKPVDNNQMNFVFEE